MGRVQGRVEVGCRIQGLAEALRKTLCDRQSATMPMMRCRRGDFEPVWESMISTSSRAFEGSRN